MSCYPTEEEEFELMYNEELEMMDEMDHYNNITREEPQPCCSKSLTQSTIPSPHLSLIPHEGPGAGGAVNRRLFSTPGGPKKIASTPLPRSDSFEMIPIDPLAEVQNVGVSRKRRLEDLFGDIRDIENEIEMESNHAKKQKSEEEKDMELINKILDARKRAREVQNPLKVDAVDRLNKLHEFNKQNLASSVPKWPFIALSHNGIDRFYVRKHSEEYEAKEINEVDVFSKGYSGLLGEMKVDIWNEAREIVLKRMTANENPVSTEGPEFMEVTLADVNAEHNLWVEKYQPKKYMELLSDESTNRSLLIWLKMWDKMVFKKEFKMTNTEKGKLNTFNKKTGRFESSGGWKKRAKNALNTDTDEYGRPMQKIALLSGPPGLGKTTLAHTIARHAGYNIREINASDDRSPEAFRLALESGTQMTSVLNQDHRPNCIILDEIDGAPQQSIDFLLKFASDSVVQKAKKGGKTKKQILRRPIICICNDMYTPALRQLRQVAFVVNFPPLTSSRLSERLSEIAQAEDLETDLSSLLALAEKSGNDIRSCLSMMQFFSASKKRLTLEDVLSSNLGQKDRHRGLFDVWSAIFQIQRPKKQVTSIKVNDKYSKIVTLTDMSQGIRVKNVLEAVHSGGDYERLMQGVYENYLHQKMPDPNLNGIVQATQWFSFSDQIHRAINQHQDYTTYGYLQYGFVAWHLLFASLAWPKINFPNKGFEMHQKTTTQKMIFQALRRSKSPAVMGIGDGLVILLDTISLIKRILSPNLRSVSLQLLTPRERYDLRHTVEIMADLGIVFIQTKAADGTYQYQLEPDIDLLCQFPAPLGNFKLNFRYNSIPDPHLRYELHCMADEANAVQFTSPGECHFHSEIDNLIGGWSGGSASSVKKTIYSSVASMPGSIKFASSARSRKRNTHVATTYKDDYTPSNKRSSSKKQRSAASNRRQQVNVSFDQDEADTIEESESNRYLSITLTYFGRQLIAREVELEIMRRSAPKSDNAAKPDQSKKIVEKKKQETSPQNLPNHLQTLKSKIRRLDNMKETISKDFFGRITTKETTLTVQEGGTDVIVKSPIWYKYKEGFNNAVRKDIYISDLL